MDLTIRRRQAYREHLSGYQRRDHEVVDYRMYELPGTRLRFRGPMPESLASGRYFTCIGAAQTFGCFCERPFPDLVSKRLGVPALNLGYGGAGPEFFERHESLDPYVNGGRFVILQVMSGRSQSNSVFECRGLEYLVRRSDGVALSADAGYRDLLYGSPALARLRFKKVTGILPRLWAAPRVRRIVEETRRAWIESHRRLLARIDVPAILFWFSRRAPSYVASLGSVDSLFGEFPQLVNSEMVAEVRGLCDYYVDCVTDRGSPQPLIGRFTGEPVTVDLALDRPEFGGSLWTHNGYYPSPEMQEDAAEALHSVCASLLENPKAAL